MREAATAALPPALELAESFARRTHDLFIEGEWVRAASGETFETINPATEAVLAAVARAGEVDVDRAVAAARRAFSVDAPWRTMRPADRAKIIWAIGDLIERNIDELAYLESLDNGKPVRHARDGELPFAADLFRYMAGWATKIEGRSLAINAMPRPGQSLAYTAREPVGVAAQIIPWNFPLLMAAWKLAPALASGCTVVLKPAEQTPLTALRLAELVQEAGMPDGVVNVLTGFGDAGAALAAHNGVDKVAFTGSTEVGRSIVKAASGNLKRVTLELGGKSPSIVFADADLDVAIRGAADAAFANIGQCCTAASRLYVERSIHDEVAQGVSDVASNIRLGAGTDLESEMGPLISEEQLQRVLGFIASGQDDGAELTVGGRRKGEVGYFIEPAVLANTAPEMSVERDEIFGPVVCVVPFDSPRAVADLANNTRYGLAAGIFTKDLRKAHETAALLQVGTVWVNTYNLNDPGIPFGGYKESGWGREMGSEAVDAYLETKAVLVSY